jgi:hypothetical protein
MTNTNDPPQPTLPELSKAMSIHLTAPEEALIRNVHPGYGKIILEKEFGGGFSKTRVFLVLPVRTSGTSDARVVTKVGLAADLQREKENYDHFAGPALPFTAAQIRNYYQQGDQAAINYTFAGGGALGETLILEDYYHAQPAEIISKTLDTLLDQTLGGTWYGQNQPLNCLFQDEYGRHLRPHDELAKIVSAVYPRLSFLDGKRIQIPGVAGTYPDPLAVYPGVLDRTLKGRRSFVHGDLHLRNVLVDESGRGWLIDFAKVKERHNLFDFIKLETYIRLMALPQVFGAFSLNEYIQFEQVLNTATLTQTSTPPANPELAKAYRVIRTIRQIARKYMGHDPDFRDEYFPALFLYVLSMLKYFPVNGHSPTQLMFITTCALAVDILKEPKTMKTIPDERPNPSKDEQSPTGKAKAARPGGVSIGGNATGNVIVNGDHNKVNQTTRKVHTGGGTYIEGNVNLRNGDFVGRDQYKTTGLNAADVAQLFTVFYATVEARPNTSPADKADLKAELDEVEKEVAKGDKTDESFLSRRLRNIGRMAPDILDVVLATLAKPMVGLGLAVRKVAEKMKAEAGNGDKL